MGDGDDDSISDPDSSLATTKASAADVASAADLQFHKMMEQRRRGNCNGPKLEPTKVRQPCSVYEAPNDNLEGLDEQMGPRRVDAEGHDLATLRAAASLGGPRLVANKTKNPVTTPRGDTMPPSLLMRGCSASQPPRSPSPVCALSI